MTRFLFKKIAIFLITNQFQHLQVKNILFIYSVYPKEGEENGKHELV